MHTNEREKKLRDKKCKRARTVLHAARTINTALAACRAWNIRFDGELGQAGVLVSQKQNIKKWAGLLLEVTTLLNSDMRL